MRWLVFLLAPCAVQAGEAGEISLSEWRDMVLGKTVTYLNEAGQLNGFERYAPAGDRVVYQYPDGSCVTGRWWYEAGLFCFGWEGREGPICVAHMREDNRIFAVTGPDGDPPNLSHEVVGIDDRTVICGDLTS